MPNIIPVNISSYTVQKNLQYKIILGFKFLWDFLCIVYCILEDNFVDVIFFHNVNAI